MKPWPASEPGLARAAWTVSGRLATQARSARSPVAEQLYPQGATPVAYPGERDGIVG